MQFESVQQAYVYSRSFGLSRINALRWATVLMRFNRVEGDNPIIRKFTEYAAYAEKTHTLVWSF